MLCQLRGSDINEAMLQLERAIRGTFNAGPFNELFDGDDFDALPTHPNVAHLQ
jgi:hypothetical protein